VCSPFEAGAIRSAVGDGVTLITPGVRPVGSAAGDQKRFMTPAQAIEAGANYLVIGRPITGQPSLEAMADAAAAILKLI
jgi:orotidine-5'-phosphate decarboxylase